MNEISKYNEIIFENIKHIDEYGNEYWYARELSKVLEYKDWRNFLKVLNKAKEACKNSGFKTNEQLVEVNKLSKRNNNATANIQDYKLSRYICYLIVQNADSNKERVSLCKTYFAIQTRKRELYSLNQTAKNCGVKNFDKFHNAGYKGLYNGETANDIAKRKKLRYREDILDNMGSEELAANLFRITQTESKLKKDNIYGEEEANQTHYNIGKNIREVIAKNGGIMPEKLPTPEI